MKKLIVVLIVLALMFTVVGCKQEAEAPVATKEVVEASAASVEDLANAYFANFESANIITWSDLAVKIDDGEEPFILSIRQADDYAKSHVEGAYIAAWGTDLAEKVAMLPKDETVYVYCYSGQTAGQTIALMRMLGIDAVSVKSGFNFGVSVTEGFEDYVSTEAVELSDAGEKFDADALAFVQDYFAAIPDSGSNIITAATLADSGRTVVDIRKTEDFDAAHIDGAINIPFGKGLQTAIADEVATNEPVAVVCYSGQTAGQTVAVLRALGYDAVSVKSGMKGYVAYAIEAAANGYFAADSFSKKIVAWTNDAGTGLFDKLDAGQTPYILSIRKADDYNTGHIVGAKLAAWGTDLAEKVAMLPTDETVYVYCYSGQTAGQTVALLNMAGIDAVSVVSGFVIGAMAVDGYEAYVSTDAVEMMDAAGAVDSFVTPSVVAYFNAIAEGGSNIIGAEDAKAAIDASEVSVVDIRKEEDFAAGHIAGAVSMPFGADMQANFETLPEGKLIVTCYSGQTAGQTVAVLRQLGYDAVSLKSGMKGWIGAEFDVVAE